MPHAQDRPYELTPDLITSYAGTFIPRADLYPVVLKNLIHTTNYPVNRYNERFALSVVELYALVPLLSTPHILT
jgi:hypothetical protein